MLLYLTIIIINNYQFTWLCDEIFSHYKWKCCAKCRATRLFYNSHPIAIIISCECFHCFCECDESDNSDILRGGEISRRDIRCWQSNLRVSIIFMFLALLNVINLDSFIWVIQARSGEKDLYTKFYKSF